ncbi:MAG TPA: hypothetical protein VJX67_22870 [Blastocatellia bacterium]|nr:hypothetical protein [Blastocatellia bacterium]
MQQTVDIKDQARKLIDSLPDSAALRTQMEDVSRTEFERLLIEEGIADLDAGRVWTSDQIRDKLALDR